MMILYLAVRIGRTTARGLESAASRSRFSFSSSVSALVKAFFKALTWLRRAFASRFAEAIVERAVTFVGSEVVGGVGIDNLGLPTDLG